MQVQDIGGRRGSQPRPNMSQRGPLLGPSPAGTATIAQTLGNIIVSVVGTGVLALPFALRVAGWLAGSSALLLAASLTYFCMTLLVECKDELESRGCTDARSYGDLGGKAFGGVGRLLTELLIVVAQCGGAVAYLVFIGQNLSSIVHALNPPAFICILVPIEVALAAIRSLASLAPFSAFADACNVLAMVVVVRDDLQLFDGTSERAAVAGGVGEVLFAAGMAVFCFEGFGMTLALEGSMRERGRFKKVLLVALVAVTIVYLCFGVLGFLAYGDETMDIVTLNLPNDWSAIAVKIGLCVGLAFTFPIMMHPIHEIIEDRLRERLWFHKLCCSSPVKQITSLYFVRSVAVVILAIVASFVPAFGAFISLVGSTVCALLSFVLPATFHFIFVSSSSKPWQRVLDILIVALGMAFACYGAYDAMSRAHA